jgi:hypothetical protein
MAGPPKGEQRNHFVLRTYSRDDCKIFVWTRSLRRKKAVRTVPFASIALKCGVRCAGLSIAGKASKKESRKNTCRFF